jgi:hypothetical protein
MDGGGGALQLTDAPTASNAFAGSGFHSVQGGGSGDCAAAAAEALYVDAPGAPPATGANMKTEDRTPSPGGDESPSSKRVDFPAIDTFSAGNGGGAPFSADGAGDGKGGPTNLSTPTGIHPLSSFPHLQHALGEVAGLTQFEVSKTMDVSFALPEHPPAGVGGHAESGGHDADAKDGDDANSDFVTAAGMTANTRSLETTEHVSNNDAAAQAMITQGTALCNTELETMGERPMSLHSDDASMDDQGEGVPTGRVDASQLEVLDNPLSKSDRYTVIKGRLPDSDPFMRAAQNLGIVFMSNEMKTTLGDLTGTEVSEDDRRAYFMRDIEAFNRELNRDYKIPIIGGGQLSLYALAMEVMKLGGLKNVVLNRAFRIVGQQLELPKSCTSAAFVLKNAYERLLYLYEQKLAFGINPTNPQRTIDMKSVVSETKRRDGEDRRNRGSAHRRSSKYTYSTVNDMGPGRVVKKAVLDVATVKQMEAIREAAAKELQAQDPGGGLLRQGSEDYPDILAYQSLHTERLTPQQPQQPESDASALVGGFGYPETNPLSLHGWNSDSTNPLFDSAAVVDILGHQPRTRVEGELDPFQIDSTVVLCPPPAAPRGIFNFDEMFSTGRVRVRVNALH